MEEIHNQHCKIPGEKTSLKSAILDVGAAMLQKFAPLHNVCEHSVGFHFYSGDINRQVIAHHYCSHLNEDVRQCLLYDSDKKDARLIGVEYMISEKLYKTLPDEEAKYWHSHVFEIKGGILTCPLIPLMVEKEVMEQLIKTYGKTYHFWQVDRGDPIPMGPPQLMMSFTKEEQVHWDLIKKRNELYDGNLEEIKKNRADIVEPDLDPRVDQWAKSGKAIQFEEKEVNM